MHHQQPRLPLDEREKGSLQVIVVLVTKYMWHWSNLWDVEGDKKIVSWSWWRRFWQYTGDQSVESMILDHFIYRCKMWMSSCKFFSCIIFLYHSTNKTNLFIGDTMIIRFWVIHCLLYSKNKASSSFQLSSIWTYSQGKLLHYQKSCSYTILFEECGQ